MVGRPIVTSGPRGGCFQIGIVLFPEHRGKGLGTAAQRLLADYLFSTTLTNRFEAATEIDNRQCRRATSAGACEIRPEGRVAGKGIHPWANGKKDGAMYARLRDDPAPHVGVE